MKITGRVIAHKLSSGINEATIELPKVDLNKIKEWDEVLIKCKIRDDKFSQGVVVAMAHHIDKVVYHFPKEEQPKPELPEEIDESNYNLNITMKTLNALIQYLREGR